jgi:hypothetical protein
MSRALTSCWVVKSAERFFGGESTHSTKVCDVVTKEAHRVAGLIDNLRRRKFNSLIEQIKNTISR